MNYSLFDAVRWDDFEAISILLNNGADPNIKAKDDSTPLHMAAQGGYLKIVELLINKSANVNAKTNNCSTPLLLAVKDKHKKVVKLLLEQGAIVSAKDKYGNSPLFFALKSQQLSLLNIVLLYQPDIDNRISDLFINLVFNYENEVSGSLSEYILTSKREDVKDFVLLLAAVVKGDLKTVEYLLANGVDPNNKKYESKLLYYAVKIGHIEVVKLLLKSGCDVNSLTETPLHFSFSKDNENKYLEIIQLLFADGANLKLASDLLSMAVHGECVEILKFLIKNGANVNEGNLCNDTPLHLTAPELDDGFAVHDEHGVSLKKVDESIRVEIARLLLCNGAEVNTRNNDGLTTLHLAVKNGFSQLTLTLLEFKANVNAETKKLCTPLHFAVKKGRKDIVEMLLKNQAEVNASLKKGKQTPLHIATHRGQTEIVDLLLKFDADINAKDKDGNTALHCAVRQNQHEIVNILLQSGCNFSIENDSGETGFELIVPFDIEVDDEDYIKRYKNLCWSDYDDYHDEINIREQNRQEVCTIDEVKKALVNHITKLKAAEVSFDTSEDIERQIDHIQKYWFPDYVTERSDDGVFSEEECKEESKRLKEVNVYHITLYDILLNYKNPTFIKNKSILQTLESFDFGDFPVYGNLLENGFKINQAMEKLLSAGWKWLNVLIKTRSVLHKQNPPNLPIELLREIITYLSKKDIHSLISCGEALKCQISG